ncbi:MAG: hypothetical protein A2W85_14370 [Bacteroidetes bacterium GWF2_41_31]|nr:MAG: hypothetical protein A2W85_14370 [Bacteroidetes bacterium GWF2_41_31]
MPPAYGRFTYRRQVNQQTSENTLRMGQTVEGSLNFLKLNILQKNVINRKATRRLFESSYEIYRSISAV